MEVLTHHLLIVDMGCELKSLVNKFKARHFKLLHTQPVLWTFSGNLVSIGIHFQASSKPTDQRPVIVRSEGSSKASSSQVTQTPTTGLLPSTTRIRCGLWKLVQPEDVQQKLRSCWLDQYSCVQTRLHSDVQQESSDC